MFRRIDTDSNGSISESELDDMAVECRFPSRYGRRRQGYEAGSRRVYDAAAEPGRQTTESSAFFQAYDTNGDGAVGSERDEPGVATVPKRRLPTLKWTIVRAGIAALNGS